MRSVSNTFRVLGEIAGDGVPHGGEHVSPRELREYRWAVETAPLPFSTFIATSTNSRAPTLPRPVVTAPMGTFAELSVHRLNYKP